MQVERRQATIARQPTEAGEPHRWFPLLAVLLLAALWRLPSLFDPPWVNDEGTYFALAQAMAHGSRLYADIWENKPPGIYLLYSAVYHSLGPSLAAIRVIALLSALGITLLTYRIVLHDAPREAALGGALLAGLLLDVPFLEGTTGNAELFLALLAAGGVYLTLARRLPGTGGLLMGGALLFKAVGALDAVALAIWLLSNRRHDLAPYLAGLTMASAFILVFAWLGGILQGLVRDAVLYDLGYVGHANGAGLPWLLLLKAAVLLVLTWFLRRAPFPYLWLVYAASGALVSGRFFGHYALQCVVPLSVCLALWWGRRPLWSRRLLRIIPCAFVLAIVLCTVAGWGMAASGHDSVFARRLQWYANFARLATGSESYDAYRSQIDDHVTRNIGVASRLQGLPRGRVLVWGNTPWVYVLSRRLPATPYTSALRDPEVPGETAALRRAVAEGLPCEVVVILPAAPPLGPAATALHRRYRTVSRVDNAVIYVSIR